MNAVDEMFPLPITPFEYYYLCDDQAAYPTTFPIELAFSGELDRGALESALAAVLARHPLLTARIDENQGGCPNWIAGDAPQIDWGDDSPESPSGPIGRQIDLTTSPGLRVFVRTGRGTSYLRCEFHHACCDGRGGCQFLEEVLIAYHAARESQPVVLPPLDPLRLRARGEFGVPTPTLWTRFRERCRRIRFWIPLLVREPQPLAAPVDTASSPAPCEPGPGAFHTRVIDGERVARLRRAAAAQQATLNDVLLCDLLLAIADWNAEQRRPAGWLRINVPISRRERSESQMPAANVLSYAFLTRKLTRATDPRQLLDSIRRETEQIRRDREKRYYIAGLGFLCRYRPALIPWILSCRKSFATAVLSNFGTVFEHTPLARQSGKLVCGNVVLERVCAVPPIRPLTRASLAVVQYAGEMTISLNWDSSCLRSEAAERFLTRYIARLDDMAGVAAMPAPAAAREAAPVDPVSP